MPTTHSLQHISHPPSSRPSWPRYLPTTRTPPSLAGGLFGSSAPMCSGRKKCSEKELEAEVLFPTVDDSGVFGGCMKDGAVGFLLVPSSLSSWRLDDKPLRRRRQKESGATLCTASSLLRASPSLGSRTSHGSLPCSASNWSVPASTPFVFRPLALDVRRAGVARLIRAFLVPSSPNSTPYNNWKLSRNNRHGRAGSDKFADEARFAAAHELGMCLCWGLSRVVRVEGV
ncbi:F-box domain-containing protein [Mycena sanguinolenta]|uniref:F-box domain-containing protein n=1 Tax=Mycena sanguinolenta TaxID=230812 RepID=A0A8H6YJC6_9AGAR|nr:F-box domain-containing protein [Mycena sanguinolenta]